MLLVSLHIIRADEQLYKHEACDKAACMRPESDAAALGAYAHGAADDLDQEPVTQHYPRRHAHRGEEESKEYECVD
jgi:hypothetical protein